MPVRKNSSIKLDNLGDSGKFLITLLSKTSDFIKHLDSQTNILIGIDLALLLFCMNYGPKIYYPAILWILGLFSGLSGILALYAIHPPRFMRKRGQPESLLYHKNIASFASAKEYGAFVEKFLDQPKEMVDQFSTEIYNMNKYYYLPKRKLFRWARNTLLTGVIISLILFFIHFPFV